MLTVLPHADTIVLAAAVAAGGAIANRAVSIDGPWGSLESVALPSLHTALGNVYMRPNEGTTDYGIDLGEYDGPVCVRSASVSIGSSGMCNFPAASPPEPRSEKKKKQKKARAWELISRMPTARLGLASVRMPASRIAPR
eukprot:SAG22_NODE_453_length_10316_cov_27.583341_9_plen_140_part_00